MDIYYEFATYVVCMKLMLCGIILYTMASMCVLVKLYIDLKKLDSI